VVKPGPAAKTASCAKGPFLLCLKKAQVLKWPGAACGRRRAVRASAGAWDAGTLSAEPMARAAADCKGLFRAPSPTHWHRLSISAEKRLCRSSTTYVCVCVMRLFAREAPRKTTGDSTHSVALTCVCLAARALGPCQFAYGWRSSDLKNLNPRAPNTSF
jgi:hypothetical protein